MKTKYILIVILVLILSGFAYWAISPLFRNVRVDDAIPVSAQKPVVPTTKDNAPAKPSAVPNTSPSALENSSKQDESVPAVDDSTPVSTSPAATSVVSPPAAENSSAAVTGTAGHPASGTVRIVSADGKNYVRYENYKTINGPDLFVYLAKDLDAKEFVNLGVLKATEGNINYEIPEGVNPQDYPYVLTWCKIFGVLFNHAEIK